MQTVDAGWVIELMQGVFAMRRAVLLMQSVRVWDVTRFREKWGGRLGRAALDHVHDHCSVALCQFGLYGLSDGAARRYYPTVNNSTSNTSFAFGGISPGTPLSRYAKCGPTRSRRRRPPRIPSTPHERPAMVLRSPTAKVVTTSVWNGSPRLRKPLYRTVTEAPRRATAPSPVCNSSMRRPDSTTTV